MPTFKMLAGEGLERSGRFFDRRDAPAAAGMPAFNKSFFSGEGLRGPTPNPTRAGAPPLDPGVNVTPPTTRLSAQTVGGGSG